jgi:hypothetical protein
MAEETRLDLVPMRQNIQSFIDDWKRMKGLVDACFAKRGVTEKQEEEFRECKERLQRLYPSIQPVLDKMDLTWSGAGRTIPIGDPVQHLLSTTAEVSYLLQDSWTWQGFPKQHFDTAWAAGTHQLNTALGRVDSKLNLVGQIHVDEYLALKRWVDRLASARAGWQRFVGRPLGNLIGRALAPLVGAVERNLAYRILAIVGALAAGIAAIVAVILFLTSCVPNPS